jgi:hypothetical protein
VTIRLNLPPSAPEGSEVVACHLDACATATLPAVAAPGYGAKLSLSRTDVSGSLVTRADGSLQLVVYWEVAMDGDRYTLVVRDGAGAELASLDETATFPRASLKSGACPMCGGTTLGDPA